MGQKATQGTRLIEEAEEDGKKKLDLSVAQVAGSSLATVAAALLASKLGVYGTILGAGVVSVVATAGGPVIQHFFRRTGGRLREAAAPKGRRVPTPAEELAVLPAGGAPAAAPPAGEFGRATTYGSRGRGWKRTTVAAGAAFALSMGGIGAYEALAGSPVSSDGRALLPGGPGKAKQERPRTPESGTDDKDGTGEKDGTGGRTGTSPTPGRSTDSAPPDPDPDPSRKPAPTPPPTPTPTPPAPTPTPTPDRSTPGTDSTDSTPGTGRGRESAS
ncbi:hypothetical protein [Streptomyces sp. NPDC051211]|uniref:hypothetical protein n=1 Tax=Streptomyces sp. NPDC051211 TaxID=3154643 RepID=UPI00344BE174